jgi:hypothetical protein
MRKLLFITLALFALNAKAQIDTINATNNKLQMQNLKEGTSNYLVYFTDTAYNRKTIGDLWQRTTKRTTFKDKPAIEFTWKWLSKDTITATVLNINDAQTLAPIHHYANYKKRGVVGYDYVDGFMNPIDTIKNNMAFKIGRPALTIPVLNWELDLETYPLLPIKKVGQKFDISFADPNSKNITYHRYEVVGKEYLQLNSETKVKCWLLKAQYTKDRWAIFWLTEKNKEVIKMQDFSKDGFRFKVKQY